MRLLFVGSHRGEGGTESHFISMARALAEAGHEVSAAVRADDFIHRGLADDDRIKLFPVEFRTRRDLRAIRDLVRIARTVRPDWIVGAFKAEYLGLAVAAKAADVPLVLFSHLDQRIRPWMLNRITRLVRAVIVPSDYLRRRTIERGLPPERVLVLPNPIDVDRFMPDPELRVQVRSSLGLRDDDVLLGYVGRFEPPKGVATLAHAANRAMSVDSRLHVLWVGHGKSEKALRDLTEHGEFPTRHHWSPWVDDVRPMYAAMDLLALPSEGSETFGRVLVEAQAYGIPVAGAANGGIPEALVEGETGLLLPKRDVERWATAIADFVSDDARRFRFGAAAREFALRFDSHRIADEFLDVLEALSPATRVARQVNTPRAPVASIRPEPQAVGD
jgi:glycosyltransferase involved in cell wall biosynthesis